MNNDIKNIPDYETTVRSSENMRDKMEGILNEPNRFRSTENEKNQEDSSSNSIQSMD